MYVTPTLLTHARHQLTGLVLAGILQKIFHSIPLIILQASTCPLEFFIAQWLANLYIYHLLREEFRVFSRLLLLCYICMESEETYFHWCLQDGNKHFERRRFMGKRTKTTKATLNFYLIGCSYLWSRFCWYCDSIETESNPMGYQCLWSYATCPFHYLPLVTQLWLVAWSIQYVMPA